VTPHRIDSLRLVGPNGTNKVMAGELSRLARRGLGDLRLPRPRAAGTGTLVYPLAWDGGRRLAELAVHYHRTASRVLWDLYRSSARRLDPLYDDLRAAALADDRGWAADGATISIRARNVGGFAAGERQVVGAVKSALLDGARARGCRLRVDPRAPDVPLAVRMHDDAITVSIDLAGQPMHRRGYRQEGGEAPLRETLAAALVMLARHDARTEVLLDPMAGSATIAIEAALMGRAAPLWVPPRGPASDRMPAFAGAATASGPLFADTEPVVVANEIHTPAVKGAREAVQAAGVAGDVDVLHGDFRDLRPERLRRVLSRRPAREGGVIVCNPPYGERLAGEVVALYRDLGRWCRQFRGWRAAFLVANDAFADAFGGRPRIVKPLVNPPLRARFYLYDL
jgi:23S rRNA G2445 N2-methylase RlmL